MIKQEDEDSPQGVRRQMHFLLIWPGPLHCCRYHGAPIVKVQSTYASELETCLVWAAVRTRESLAFDAGCSYNAGES